MIPPRPKPKIARKARGLKAPQSQRRATASRKCIFCGGRPLAGEHVWPQWMHPLLPKLENPEKVQAYYVLRQERLVRPPMKKTQPGHTYTKKIRNVCKKCNETWMSAIEEQAISVLTPILQGMPVTLTVEFQQVLAAWIALKVMVIDQEDGHDGVIPIEAREKFMERRIIPDAVRLWIGYHDDEGWYATCWRRTIQATLSNQPAPIRRDIKNMQTTTFGVGHLLIFAFVTTLAELEFKPAALEGIGVIGQLWPPPDRMIVWPMPTIAPFDIAALSESILHLMRAPFAKWRP
jgi:hypothetical protein